MGLFLRGSDFWDAAVFMFSRTTFIVVDGTKVYVTFIIAKRSKSILVIQRSRTNVPSNTIYEDQTCLNHLEKALSDLLTFIPKIVSENGTN